MSIVCHSQPNKIVVTQDIPNFWNAYDSIILTKDSLLQIDLINRLYIAKASPGLQGMMQVKNYTAPDYIYAINNYPKFWNSVRNNTLKAGKYAGDIEKGIQQLRKLYPALKPANIYFTIGVLRSGGTTLDNRILIGSEVALTDKNTVSSEFEKRYPHLRRYFDTDPVNGNVTFLNVHEYIHTQQKLSSQYSLLAQSIVEGVAEFVTVKALGIPSPNPQIKHGKIIDDKLRPVFIREMFATDFNNWLWNSPDNEFGMGDMGYYIGYTISEKYYSKAADKKKAISDLINFDYADDEKLYRLVDQSGYFDKPIKELRKDFESRRPKVIRVDEVTNGRSDISPTITTITLHFSQAMNDKFADFDFGPLGREHVLWVQKRIGFSEDGRSYKFEVKMEPGRHYQLKAPDYFRNAEGYAMEPYLIDFTTAK